MRLYTIGIMLAAAVVLCGAVTLPCLAAKQPYSGLMDAGGAQGIADLVRGNDTVSDASTCARLQSAMAHGKGTEAGGRGAHERNWSTFPSDVPNCPSGTCNSTPPADGTGTRHDRMRFNMTPSAGLPNRTCPDSIANGTPPADWTADGTLPERIRGHGTFPSGSPNGTHPHGVCIGTRLLDSLPNGTLPEGIWGNGTSPDGRHSHGICNGTPLLESLASGTCPSRASPRS